MSGIEYCHYHKIVHRDLKPEVSKTERKGRGGEGREECDGRMRYKEGRWERQREREEKEKRERGGKKDRLTEIEKDRTSECVCMCERVRERERERERDTPTKIERGKDIKERRQKGR